MKVTSLYGDGMKENELYEQALKSHDEHNALFGYEMRVQLETVANMRVSGLAFLLSVLVQELGKVEEERVEWLMYVSPLSRRVGELQADGARAGGSIQIQSSSIRLYPSRLSSHRLTSCRRSFSARTIPTAA